MTNSREQGMKKLLRRVAAAALAAAPVLVLAQEQPATEAFNIESISCWDVITLPEDDATFVTAMLIGYANGQTSQSQTSPKAIVDLVEKFDETCAEHPDASALEVLKQ